MNFFFFYPWLFISSNAAEQNDPLLFISSDSGKQSDSLLFISSDAGEQGDSLLLISSNLLTFHSQRAPQYLQKGTQ